MSKPRICSHLLQVTVNRPAILFLKYQRISSILFTRPFVSGDHTELQAASQKKVIILNTELQHVFNTNTKYMYE